MTWTLPSEMNMRLVGLLLALASTPSLFACAESQVDGVGGASSSSSSSSQGSSKAATGTGAGNGTTASSVAATSTSVTTGGGPGGVVINELSGTGSDYVELFNAGSALVDLSGVKVADQDTPGTPKLASALTLPAGTSLAPGAYLFILGGQASSSTAPETMCAPGPSPCFFASYKLSNKNGDEVFLVDANDAVLESVTYPGNLSAGQTWGRLPNGTGPFAVTASTPGATNAP